MNNLTIISQQGELLVDSRDIAKMIEVRHADLLDKINGYIQYLESGKFRSQDFFIASTYKVDGNNKNYDCYLLTRKGCDMVANKMTGEKGILFTATYVTEFERMSKQQKLTALPQVEVDLIAAKYASEILRPSEAGKINMLAKVCKNHNVNTNFLPRYTEEDVTRSATELLEKHGKPMSAVAFNKRLLALGFLEVKTRNGKGNTKKEFKSLTEAGLTYGKNLVSPMNERETQAHFYEANFVELLRKISA
jgi:Rha family phage regulatory protein